MKEFFSYFFFLVLLCNSANALAQTEAEQKPETANFEDYFFESLKQKGIENYDKAIVALEKCLKLKPDDATVYFEMGKNYLASKSYENAYVSFEKATQFDPKNKWFWAGMYDTNYQTQNYNQAIITVNKLIEFDENYKEDLVSLYMNTQQFDKALVLIDELTEKFGKSKKRDAYKNKILSQGKFQGSEIENLEAQIEKNPKEEANYIALIELYSKNNDYKKAIELTKKLEAEIPTSEWAQIGLFKLNLDNKNIEKAVQSMQIILASATIDTKIKHRTLTEFLNYETKNPQNASDLEKALASFEKDLQNSNSQDVENYLLVCQGILALKKFELLSKKADAAIEVFPTEPQFYYYAGLANNQLKQFKKARDLLEMGMDYVVNKISLEINFNIQLGEAWNGLGDSKKKESYFEKANQLLKK